MYNTNSLPAQHSISRKLSQKETQCKCYSLSQYLKHWSGEKFVPIHFFPRGDCPPVETVLIRGENHFGSEDYATNALYNFFSDTMYLFMKFKKTLPLSQNLHGLL